MCIKPAGRGHGIVRPWISQPEDDMKQTIKTGLAALAVVLCFAAGVQDAVATISPAGVNAPAAPS